MSVGKKLLIGATFGALSAGVVGAATDRLKVLDTEQQATAQGQDALPFLFGMKLYAGSRPFGEELPDSYIPDTELPSLRAQSLVWKMAELGIRCPVDADTQLYSPENDPRQQSSVPEVLGGAASTQPEQIGAIPLAVCIDYSKIAINEAGVLEVPLALQEWPNVPRQEIFKNERTAWCESLAARYGDIVNEQIVLTISEEDPQANREAHYPLAIAMSAYHEDPCDTVFQFPPPAPDQIGAANKSSGS